MHAFDQAIAMLSSGGNFPMAPMKHFIIDLGGFLPPLLHTAYWKNSVCDGIHHKLHYVRIRVGVPLLLYVITHIENVYFISFKTKANTCTDFSFFFVLSVG